MFVYNGDVVGGGGGGAVTSVESGESEPDLSMAKWQNALTYMNASTIFAIQILYMLYLFVHICSV